MNIEDHLVVSLELSKKLLTLGVKQNSVFVWEYHDDKCYGIKFFPYAVVPDETNKFKLYSAFIVGEIGELLPNMVTREENAPFNNFRIFINKYRSISLDEKLNITNNWIINYECDATELTGENAWLRRKLTKNIYDTNLANAMAKMLIYLIENNLYIDAP